MKILFYLTLIILVGCASDDPNKRSKKGAAIGAATGAVAGSVLSKKDKKKGAMIGGFLGTVAGGTIGKRMDEQAKELDEVAETQRTDSGIITKLKGDITFDTGEAILTSDARSRIKRIGEIISQYPEDMITVAGHTDSTGSTGLNQRLSEKRAMTVMQILTSAGVPSSQIATVGAGESNPIASNNTTDGRAANRRVEIIIQPSPEKLRAE